MALSYADDSSFAQAFTGLLLPEEDGGSVPMRTVCLQTRPECGFGRSKLLYRSNDFLCRYCELLCSSSELNRVAVLKASGLNATLLGAEVLQACKISAQDV